ncbi:MAG: sigma-70 family RNA polymerase sigma factor [Erysipelotrichaceae bacterium]|nr:sigma-70 family RNA polymerase sigma factor [Erysipelotrichaceae bacterium]MBR5049526.1 sigma-70 family RNA polymerase sigma factor [Erysipelotrichaceae bacterium]
MDRFEYINELLPFYESLLTERQQQIVKLYYYEDLSLSEIAEELQISRNGVHDTLKKVGNILAEYEEKLQLNAAYQQRIELYGKLREHADERGREIIDELVKMED